VSARLTRHSQPSSAPLATPTLVVTASGPSATGTRMAGTAPAVARWLTLTTVRAATNTPTSRARYPFTGIRT
jgi:hypothetical protein